MHGNDPTIVAIKEHVNLLIFRT